MANYYRLEKWGSGQFRDYKTLNTAKKAGYKWLKKEEYNLTYRPFFCITRIDQDFNMKTIFYSDHFKK